MIENFLWNVKHVHHFFGDPLCFLVDQIQSLLDDLTIVVPELILVEIASFLSVLLSDICVEGLDPLSDYV